MAEPHDTGRSALGQGRLRLFGEKSGRKYGEERDPDDRRRRPRRQGQHNQSAPRPRPGRDRVAASDRHRHPLRVLLPSPSYQARREEPRGRLDGAPRPRRAGEVPDHDHKSRGEAAQALRGAFGGVARHRDDGAESHIARQRLGLRSVHCLHY